MFYITNFKIILFIINRKNKLSVIFLRKKNWQCIGCCNQSIAKTDDVRISAVTAKAYTGNQKRPHLIFKILSKNTCIQAVDFWGSDGSSKNIIIANYWVVKYKMVKYYYQLFSGREWQFNFPHQLL